MIGLCCVVVDENLRLCEHKKKSRRRISLNFH